MTELDKLEELCKGKIIGYEKIESTVVDKSTKNKELRFYIYSLENDIYGFFCETEYGLWWWRCVSHNIKKDSSEKPYFEPSSIKGINAKEAFDFIVGGCKEYEKIEAVNHPLHYGGDTPYECIKVLKAWLSPDEYRGFCRGNFIKYVCRLGKKDDSIQELKKARFYLDKLIESYEA